MNGEQAVVGNRMLFKELGILALEGSVSDDVTEIFVARGGRYLGSILISDQLRPSSAAAVRSLRAMNIKVGCPSDGRYKADSTSRSQSSRHS